MESHLREKRPNCLPSGYTFSKVIGRGNYSRIWKATDNRSNRTVAVKEIHKCITSEKRFHKELRYGKLLRGHSNINTIHGLLRETDSAYFMVLEYASGGDLCKYVASRGRLEEDDTRLYFRQICTAIQHMHRLHLVHLDIKSDNILLKTTESHHVELVDFGMTERLGKKLKVACGTLPYMAPEMFDLHGLPVRGLRVRRSFDMWSLGVVLYSMATGNFPWMQAILTDPDYAEFYRWQVEQSQSTPEDWCELSPELATLLRALLAVEPRNRCKIHQVFDYDFLRS